MQCLKTQEYQRMTGKENSFEEFSRLELLPVELLEIIFSQLRSSDLVALAHSSPHLSAIVSNARLWRRRTVQLSSDTLHQFLRQIRLAPELKEVQMGFGVCGLEVGLHACHYNGPMPRIRALNVKLSNLGIRTSADLLLKYGQTARHLQLDLRHGPFEPPRDHAELTDIILDLCCVESVAVRIDNVKDIAVLHGLPSDVKLVDIDIHHLRVGDVIRGGPGPLVGAAAAQLVFQHCESVQTLRLPPNFDENLCRAVTTCKGLRTLACNVWTLPALEHLSNLHTLLVFPPDDQISVQDIQDLVSYARRSRKVLANLKELRLVHSNVAYDILSTSLTADYAQAVFCLLFVLCRSLEVLEVQWDVGDIVPGERSWFSSSLFNNAASLRELRFRDHQLSPPHFLSVAKYCHKLRILDVRRIARIKPSTGTTEDKKRPENLTSSGMKRALHLLQESHPNLTLLFDDDAEEIHDWNIYIPQSEITEVSGSIQPYLLQKMTDSGLPENTWNKLFLHTQSLDQWARIFSGHGLPPWRSATLDSSMWSNQEFIKILKVVPALGLLDCRNRKELSPGKRGHRWIEAVARGPVFIAALRVRAGLVSADLWELMPPLLRRIGMLLRCLELDFRGRSFREFRNVLSVIGELPNLTEFVLRGRFRDDQPVLDLLLHGRVPSLTRLDLRDCIMSNCSQKPAFVSSLQRLLLELKGTIRAVAFPPLPQNLAANALHVLSELTELREVALHANELESLRPLKAISSLELFGDRRPTKSISLDRLAVSLRSMYDTGSLKRVQRLVLPAYLIKSQLVQDAIFDSMPNLRKIEVIHDYGGLRQCAEGPQCKTLLAELL